jgi:putative chitinase
MIPLTIKILKSICPAANVNNLAKYIDFLNQDMPMFEINTLLRERHFIAQVAHESGSFNYSEEIASGEAYEGIKDLGNTFPGDGVKFKGRGLIQITGRNNYTLMANELGLDCVNHPKMVATPEYAVKSACWFWSRNGLNALADQNDIQKITKRINGGYNGMPDRMNLYVLAQKYIV